MGCYREDHICGASISKHRIRLRDTLERYTKKKTKEVVIQNRVNKISQSGNRRMRYLIIDLCVPVLRFSPGNKNVISHHNISGTLKLRFNLIITKYQSVLSRQLLKKCHRMKWPEVDNRVFYLSVLILGHSLKSFCFSAVVLKLISKRISEVLSEC